MKRLLQFLGVLFLFQAMNMLWSFNDECKHIYVAVEQAKVETGWASFVYERKDLVCVKCFHQTKQEIIQVGKLDTFRVRLNYMPFNRKDTAIGTLQIEGGTLKLNSRGQK